MDLFCDDSGDRLDAGHGCRYTGGHDAPSGPGADVEYIIWTCWCQGGSDPLEKSVITGLEGAREVGR